MAIALVFPGQGAQYVGMGMELAQQFPKARQVLDQADKTLRFAISDVIAHGPDDELIRTDMSQPAILVASWMSYQVAAQQIQPFMFDATGGLSLGEYTALVAAEAISFADALELVRVRGRAMQEAAEAVPSGMVALIGADETAAAALCDDVRGDEVLQVANLNSTGQVVISGSQGACERAVAAAKDHGIRRAMPLKVAGAFHSALMEPAAEKLAKALARVSFSDPQVPVYSNVTAEAVTCAGDIPDLLIKQLTNPVRWAASVENMTNSAEVTTYLELGPGKTLGGMISRTVKDVNCYNLDNLDDLERLIKLNHSQGAGGDAN